MHGSTAGDFGWFSKTGAGLVKHVRTASLLLLSFVVAAALAACSDAESETQTTAPSPAEYRQVRFLADDGSTIVGRLWANGKVAVILAHGFSEETAQDDWLPFAPALAQERYTVLTFNFRGFCDSKGCSGDTIEAGNNWRDTLAAVDFIKARGAEEIFLIGASLGGLAVLRAARTPGVDLAGVISLSTPQFPSRYYTGETPANDLTPSRLAQIDEPKLFVAGEHDVQLPGTAPLRFGVSSVAFASDAERMFEAAEEPKELELVDSRVHSSGLVTTATDEIVEETRALIYRFLEANTTG